MSYHVNSIRNLSRLEATVSRRLYKVFKRHDITNVPMFFDFESKDIYHYVKTKRMTQEHADKLKMLWDIAESIYPGRCEIKIFCSPKYTHFVNEYGGSYGAETEFMFYDGVKIDTKGHLTIHFPEVNLTNENGDLLKMRDFFVKVTFDIKPNGTLIISYILGTKMTWSEKEYKNNFVHSHTHAWGTGSRGLKLMGDPIFKDFCTGSDSDFSISRSVLNEEFSPEALELYLLQIEPFVNWESLEGGPYFLIANLGNGVSIPHGPNISEIKAAYRLFTRSVKRKLSSGEKLSVDWVYSDGKYFVKDNEKLEDLLINVLYPYISEWFFERDSRGIPLKVTRVEPYQYVQTQCRLNFKHQTFITTVIPDPGEDHEPKKKYIHPLIKDYVRKQLESTTKDAKVRACGINRINSFRNSRLRIRSNQVLVQTHSSS